MSVPSGTVTFLLCDVEASTSLWQSSPEAMGRAMARCYELVGDVVARRGGFRPEEQGEGDSAVAVFVRASDALACALDLQRAMAAGPWPERAELRLRVGLHTGDAALRDERNYTGPAIHRCARLRAIGHGGQTLLSRSTCELVVDDLPDGATLRDLGLHRLRDLDRPEHVHQLCHADLAGEFLRCVRSPRCRTTSRFSSPASSAGRPSSSRPVSCCARIGC